MPPKMRRDCRRIFCAFGLQTWRYVVLFVCLLCRKEVCAEEDFRRLWESSSLLPAENASPVLEGLAEVQPSGETQFAMGHANGRPSTFREAASLSALFRDEDLRGSRRHLDSLRFSTTQHSLLELREGVYQVSDWRIAAAARTFRPPREKSKAAVVQKGFLNRARRPFLSASSGDGEGTTTRSFREASRESGKRAPAVVGLKTFGLGALLLLIPLSRFFRDTLVGRVFSAYTRLGAYLLNKVSPVEVSPVMLSVGLGLALVASGAFSLASSFVAHRARKTRSSPRLSLSDQGYPVRGEALVLIGLLSLLLSTQNRTGMTRLQNERLDICVGLMFPSLFAGLALLIGSLLRRALQTRSPETALVLGLTNQGDYVSSQLQKIRDEEQIIDVFGLPERRSRRP